MLDGEATLRETIAQCDALYAESSKPGAIVSIRERSAILNAKASAAARLARLRGEDVISIRKILDSKEWKEIKDAVYRVLVKYPDAARLLAEELERLDAIDNRNGRRGSSS